MGSIDLLGFEITAWKRSPFKSIQEWFRSAYAAFPRHAGYHQFRFDFWHYRKSETAGAAECIVICG